MSAAGILSVDEVCKKHGLIYLGYCSTCGGYPTRKYGDSKNHILRWRETQYMFQFSHRNDILKNWTLIGELVAYLDNFYAEKTT